MEHHHPPPRYCPLILAKIDQFNGEARGLDALNVELTPGRHSEPYVICWAVGLDHSRTVVAAVLMQHQAGRPALIAVHQGDRITAGQWLRSQGVPCVRIGTRQPLGSSPVRFNPTFQGATHEQR